MSHSPLSVNKNMSYLDRIQTCNHYDLNGFLPFNVDGDIVGWVRPDFAARLAHQPDAFKVTADHVAFSETFTTADQRSDLIASLGDDWVTEGVLPKLRREMYPVRATWSGPDYFRLDRGLVPLFGVRAYGVHLNGFVKRPDGIYLWIGRRSADRRIEPNKLDNLVAGGQPANLGLHENLIKECAEEAGMSPELAGQAVPVGTISYCFENANGLKPDTLFCYDLSVPEGFEPQNQDGEIASFQMMPVEEALQLIKSGDSFKFNVSLVILDFAIRHGLISPDSEPDYEAILAGLHATQPVA